jgi:hypothetical protein
MGWKETYSEFFQLEQEVRIQANNETKNQNIFQFTGSIQVVAQYAEVLSVINASNMTGVYADLWDGTNSVKLTKHDPGADFSGLCAGSVFSKLGVKTESYYLNLATQARVLDVDLGDVGYPFIITAKDGVDNFIRFNYTTNTILDFIMKVFFRYRTINGGTLEFV